MPTMISIEYLWLLNYVSFAVWVGMTWVAHNEFKERRADNEEEKMQ